MSAFYQPDLLYVDGHFRSDYAIEVADDGTIASLGAVPTDAALKPVRMRNRAILPGMVDIHSHSFQRALRGKAESRRRSGPDFWSWRNIMYRCALALTPEDIYDVARMAFLEMMFAGITTVGEFHYLHRTSKGDAYDDPNLLSKRIIGAAQSVGIRVSLLRCAYARSGFGLPQDDGQVRFIEPDADEFLRNAEALKASIEQGDSSVSFGIAPHSIRAVTCDYLETISNWAQEQKLPVHMHVAEQPAEIEACIAEYGISPFHFLANRGLLNERFTAIHAIHLQPGEVERMAEGRITVGACPTTERNLGDGILPSGQLLDTGVSIALGTDSHTQTDALENARELESNLRLQQLQRAVLDGRNGEPLPKLLMDCATVFGARSLKVNTGALEVGRQADFFSVDLSDMSIAGSPPEELLTNIVFSMSPRAIRDVVVAGKLVVDDGQHIEQQRIIEAFASVQQRLGAEL